MTQPYYPPLSDLVPVDRIPHELEFIGDALTGLLDGLYYRNLFFEKSLRGESGFYQFELVFYKSAGINVPGTGGLALLINPSDDATGNTVIPVEFEYRWEILKYFSGFSLENFADSARAFFDLLMDMIGATEEQLLSEVIAVFVDDPLPITKFVDDFNAKYNPAAPLELNAPAGADIFEHIVGQLSSAATTSTCGSNLRRLRLGRDRFRLDVRASKAARQPLARRDKRRRPASSDEAGV